MISVAPTGNKLVPSPNLLMSHYLTVDDLTEYKLPAGPIATLQATSETRTAYYTDQVIGPIGVHFHWFSTRTVLSHRKVSEQSFSSLCRLPPLTPTPLRKVPDSSLKLSSICLAGELQPLYLAIFLFCTLQ